MPPTQPAQPLPARQHRAGSSQAASYPDDEIQGWYLDPYGKHGERWFSRGEPTDLVRDGDTESTDPLPLPRPPGDRSRNGLLFGVSMALTGLAAFWALLMAASTGLNQCADECYAVRYSWAMNDLPLVDGGLTVLTLVLVLTRPANPGWRRIAAWASCALCGLAWLLIVVAMLAGVGNTTPRP